MTFVCFMYVGGAQSFFGPERIIYISELTVPASLHVADMDGDSDQDVVSAYNGSLIWYKYLDSSGTFSTQLFIDSVNGDATSIYAADLDGDLDLDLVAAFETMDRVVWYENLDGEGNFGTPSVITDSADRAWSVYTCDIDGDGDKDVLSASVFDDKVAWYENMDGQGSFGTQKIITTSAHWAISVRAADLDGDGDQDVYSMSGSWADNKIAWYENTDGLGDFGKEQIITTSINGALSVLAADLDGDGAKDMLSASAFDNKIAWYRNTNGKGAFGPQQIITTLTDGASYVYASDLDGDGDLDVLSASRLNNQVAYYENTDGTGIFGPQRVISSTADEAGFVYAHDFDGDGDQDVLAASCDFKIAWQKNTLPLEIVNGPTDTTISPFANCSFGVVAVEEESYLWQVDEGNGFMDLQDDTTYSGVRSDTLFITSAMYRMTGNQYRCVLTHNMDSLYTHPALLTIIDNVKPVITSLHDDQIVDANMQCKAILPDYTLEVTATDNGQQALEIVQTPLPWTTLLDSITQVKITVTDDAWNSAEVSFLVRVRDRTPPVIVSSHGDQELEADVDCQAFVPNYTYNIEATDNCNWSSELMITQDPFPGTLVSGAINEVNLSVRDQAGNVSNTVFNLGVIDREDPSISCNQNQVVTVDQERDVYIVAGTEFDPLYISDNCVVGSVHNDLTGTSTLDSASIPIGITTIVWSVSDEAGNEAWCSFDVIVSESSGFRDLATNGIHIYPNPTDGAFHYESEVPIRFLRILDMSGSMLLEMKDLSLSGVIDLSRFKAGIYQLHTVTENNSITVKILKE